MIRPSQLPAAVEPPGPAATPLDPEPSLTALPPEALGRQRAWIEVSTEAIEANARSLSRFLGASTRLMAVVKADGYGHGAVPVARAALAGGAREFGVATLAEGIELRRAGIEAPILLLGNLSQADELRLCLHWQLMPTLSGLREAQLCQTLAQASGRRLAVHLKLDTGMSRLGADWQEGAQLVAALAELDALDLRGLYSHLASADLPGGEDGGLTRLQQQRYEDVLGALRQQGLEPGCRHLANSAATLRDPALHFDMVRVGLALYGQPPASHLADRLPLQPAMAVRARVSLIREVPAGAGVSYGHRFRTRRASRLAVVGIGYADGVPRLLSNQLRVLIGGRPVPQVGAITMDQLVLDVTDHPAVEVGSIVTLLGRDGEHSLAPDDWCAPGQLIAWEVLCGFKHRLPRLVVERAGR